MPSDGANLRASTRKNPRGPGRFVLAVTRIVIPVTIAVVGLVAVIIGGGKDDVVAGAGVALIICGLIVWMVNWMYRMSVQSNREREREEEAREYFDVHGRWPGE
jgi:FtsH-binding integral membrane protein